MFMFFAERLYCIVEAETRYDERCRFPLRQTSDSSRIRDGPNIWNTLSLPTELLIFLVDGKEGYSSTMIDGGLEIVRASVSIVLIAAKDNCL